MVVHKSTKKRIALLAALLLGLLGILNVVDENRSVGFGRANSDDQSMRRTSEWPNRDSGAPGSMGREFRSPSDTSLLKQSPIRDSRVGGVTRLNRPVSTVADAGPLIYFIRSSDILLSNELSADDEELLKSATESAIKKISRSGDTIVLNADTPHGSQSRFLLHADPHLDLTERVKEEYENLKSQQEQSLSRNRADIPTKPRF